MTTLLTLRSFAARSGRSRRNVCVVGGCFILDYLCSSVNNYMIGLCDWKMDEKKNIQHCSRSKPISHSQMARMQRDTPKSDRERAKIPVNGGLIMSYYKTKVAMWLPCGPAQQWPPNDCSRLHQTLCYSLSNSGMPAVVVCSTVLKKESCDIIGWHR